jgi:hypothetical protein
MRNLSERTGVCGLAFFTRSSIHDTAVPTWLDSDDAIAFVSEVLKLEPMEFLGRFEQWAIARNRGMCRVEKNSLKYTHVTITGRWWSPGESANYEG